MLKELSIKNIAIIRQECVSPEEGLTVLTGETGAGKSIIIDSVGLIMGERASKELIRGGTSKAMVSALFDGISDEVSAAAAELGIEIEDGTLLFQRDITASGGSTARINGRAVPLSIVRELAPKLITIHGQHSGESLLNEETHIRFLDAFADAEAEKSDYAALYDTMLSVQKRIAAIARDEQEKARTIEQLRFQIKDIDAVSPREGEEEELKNKRTKLQNAEKITKHAKLIYRALARNEKGFSACDLIDKALEAMDSLEGVIKEAPAYVELLTDFRYRIEDIAETIRGECDFGVKNPSELLDKIEERLDNLQRLRKKYGATVTEIREYRARAMEKLHDLECSEELAQDLENELSDIRKRMKAIGAAITAKRRAAAKALEERITAELVFLDMEKVRFRIEVAPLAQFAQNGMDRVAFLVSANPGEPLQPLAKVASGGELSRMMLALRCAFADKEHTGTLIFDEIDTGISGRTSHRIGVKLREVASSGTQVICVTHSPQIAAIAKTHLFVSKTEIDGRTESSVRILERAEREEEIARIIGGAEITDQTLAAARELLDANL
ncbi:MAG: DNA repair protein RecN [Clostridia bacterium]|nr:DNA repair protein RecN [Clostridia bacterium]